MRCLLVDDEPGIREGLAALLRKKGHEVHTAGDCAAAAAALAGAPDVVVTDWRLPDGTADSFWHQVRCPIVAVSGHPEEVQRDARVQLVLTKPVTPARLLAVLAGLAAEAVPERRAPAHAADTERAIEAFVTRLPPATSVERVDDGTFVTVVVRPPASLAVRPTSRDGDLCWVTRAGNLEGRLRLRRDGRSATTLPVVGPRDGWPAAGDFVVDCAASVLDAPDLFACLERIAAVRRAGRAVQLWNVPDHLIAVVSSHGTAHDMPMREPVGPSLQAESADLWREP